MHIGSEVLAFTTAYGDRAFLPDTVRAHRARAGLWFDWLVCLGAPSEPLLGAAQRLLEDPDRLGIQYLRTWPQNRGQHHATLEALTLARSAGYKWLLRIDDDVAPKTKGYLTTMLERLERLKALAGDGQGDSFYRIVASPRVLGLNNPLQPVGQVRLGQPFTVEVHEFLGGACRLHPVSLLDAFEPPLWNPIGRGDPQALASYLSEKCVGALQVVFPDIRVNHPTNALEGKDSGEARVLRKMGYYWPYIPGEAPA